MTKLKTDLKDPKDTTCALEKNKLIALFVLSLSPVGQPGLGCFWVSALAISGELLTTPKANGVYILIVIPQMLTYKSSPDQ